MKIKKLLLGAVLIVIGLPLVAVLAIVLFVQLKDWNNGSVVSSGQERPYIIHVPESYDSARPTPLVISMHSAATWPAHQMNVSGWNQLADEHGFIVVYPAGSGFPRVFGPGPAATELEVQYISDLIDKIEAEYNVDSTMIYANGFSNGGGMAFALSCTLADRIAAIGMVAPAMMLPADWCDDNRPIPMIAFHGDADPIIPYEGGPLGDPFNPVKPMMPAVREWLMDWVARNRCATEPVVSEATAGISYQEFVDCADDAPVILYTIHGGGHTWPGGESPGPEWHLGTTSHDVDATRVMWDFFRDHPRSPSTPD